MKQIFKKFMFKSFSFVSMIFTSIIILFMGLNVINIQMPDFIDEIRANVIIALATKNEIEMIDNLQMDLESYKLAVRFKDEEIERLDYKLSKLEAEKQTVLLKNAILEKDIKEALVPEKTITEVFNKRIKEPSKDVLNDMKIKTVKAYFDLKDFIVSSVND